MNNPDTSSRRMRFRRVGGSYQLDIQCADDLPWVLELDEALWALTSIDIAALGGVDPQFLQFLDSDGNGRIRSDEVKRAVDFLWRTLRDHSGIDRASEVLPLAAIDPASPEGSGILDAARQVLYNLGCSDATEITLGQVRDNCAVLACARQNGDGVLPPEALPDPELAALVREIMDKTGAVTDRGGLPGISVTELERYLGEAQTYLAWHKEGEASDELSPFGERTAELYSQFARLREPLDRFYLACGALRFLGAVPAPIEPEKHESLAAFLKEAPVAPPNPDAALSVAAPLNPLWREALRSFFAEPEIAPLLVHGILAEPAWEKLKLRFQPYADWLSRSPSTLFAEADRPALLLLEQGDRVARLRAYMQEDLDAGAKIACCDRLCALLLFQCHMLEFIDNYVSLRHLFELETQSFLQAGTLVMDGRHFTLATVIGDVAAHKAIAQNSDICVMYLEAATGDPGALRTMKLAVAVTSGHMRNLFIGKCGVFFTGNGETWDAKVIDFIQQPVSISEAFVMPFLRFGAFIGKQADKFFTTQSNAIQKNMENSVTGAAATLPGSAPNPAAPPVPTSPPAISGSMLLMGGGIGIAAIGSSVAFIAQAVQHISIVSVLAVLFGVILIFGGPVVAVSLVKLYRRNVARFLEANRCGVNRSMRLTRKMGLIFTHAPALPRRSLVNPHDLVNLIVRTHPGRKWVIRSIVIVIAVGILLAVGYWLGNTLLPVEK